LRNNKEQDLLNNLISNNNATTKDFVYCIFLNLNNSLEFILKNNLYLLRIYTCFKIQLILIKIK